jgi:hypothetical protein
VIGAGGWTRAGSSEAMALPHDPSSQGAGHAILPPAALADQRLCPPGPLARQALRPAPAAAAWWHPVRYRPPHRHFLVPCLRRHRRVPPCLHHRLRRRTPGRPPGHFRRPGGPSGPGQPQAPDRGHRRHAHCPLRPGSRGRGHPPQPQPWARRREVRLRPRLGRAGSPGQARVLGHDRPPFAGAAVHPQCRRGQAAPGAETPLPHQAGVGGTAASPG